LLPLLFEEPLEYPKSLPDCGVLVVELVELSSEGPSAESAFPPCALDGSVLPCRWHHLLLRQQGPQCCPLVFGFLEQPQAVPGTIVLAQFVAETFYRCVETIRGVHCLGAFLVAEIAKDGRPALLLRRRFLGLIDWRASPPHGPTNVCGHPYSSEIRSQVSDVG
jgi:hypothetical protein